MYKGVSTLLRLPCGLTEPVPFRCGTIQGDSWSMTLFSIFLSPLLKCLDAGSAGYAPGCLKAKLAALGFVDDVAIATTSSVGGQRQMDKISRFCKWSGMKLNAKKCAHTALRRTPASGEITIDGVNVPVLGPDETNTWASTRA